MAIASDIAEDAARLRKLLRDARKLTKRMERTVRALSFDPCFCQVPAPTKQPEPPAPRWRLNATQLQTISNRLNLAEAGTYAEVATELGIDGDLYAMIDETFRAACRHGLCPDWPGGAAKGKWLESYRDSRSAFARYRAIAAHYFEPDNQQRSNDG